MDDDDDLLAEVLLRLPPQSSSLPRASLVCPRWRHLLAEPGFLRRFRAHHRKPPLLGFFSNYYGGSSFSFTPVLDPPDRIPAARFSLPLDHGYVLACRHGRVLILKWKRLQLVVWDPVTGEQLHLAVPPPLHTRRIEIINGAVLCAARCQGHLRDGCCHRAYQVALFGANTKRVFACAYSSETGVWGNLLSVACPAVIQMRAPITLIRDSLYLILFTCNVVAYIVQLDLDKHSLAVYRAPSYVDFYGSNCWTMRTKEGGFGFILLKHFRAQFLKLMATDDGVLLWERGKTIELDMLRSTAGREDLSLKGFAEDNDVMLVGTTKAVFMVNIQSTKFKKLSDSANVGICHPFASFYGASNNMPLHTYSAGYRPACSGSGSEGPSAMLNLPPDQDGWRMPRYKQLPPIMQETQGTQDVEQPQGRTKRMTRAVDSIASAMG